jgi:hypothetical protein
VAFNGLLVINPNETAEVIDLRDRGLSQGEIQKLVHEANNLIRDDGRSNENADMATPLAERLGFEPFTFYEAVGSISDGHELDWYSVRSPIFTGPLPDGMDPPDRAVYVHTSLRSLRNGTLIPRARVFDSERSLMRSEILVNGQGELVIQTALKPNQDYFVVVDADRALPAFQRGNYRLNVFFSNENVEMTQFAEGMINDDQNGHALFIARSQLFHFALDAFSPDANVADRLGTGIIASFLNEKGQIVHHVATEAGKTRSSQSVLLAPGSYIVQVFPISLNPLAELHLRYQIRGTQVSDPFAVDPDDPTSDPYFECPGQEGLFCYPGGIISDDPFLWDDFLDSLPEIPDISQQELISLLLGDWWQWYWNQSGQNGPALAYDDYYAVAPGSQLTVPPSTGVLANDLDPEGDPLTVLLQEDVSHGLLSLAVNGGFVYQPNPGFVGVDSFTYVAYDFHRESAPGRVVIEVFSTTGIPGDFDGNSIVDERDVDLLAGAIRGTRDYVFDIDDSGAVDGLDLDFLIHDILHTFFGDANLDGQFNTSDLIAIFQIGEYEDSVPLNSRWGSGDWNADGEFDTGDLVAAFQDGGYLAAAVPTDPVHAIDAAWADLELDARSKKRASFR